MPSNNWIEIYRSKSTADLYEDMARIERALSTPYSSQSVGSKSYTIDRQALESQLAAARRVLNERQGSKIVYRGVVDLS